MTWSKDEKSGRSRRARNRGRDRAPKADAGDVSAWEASKQRAEKRRKRGRVGWLVAGVLVALLVVVALLPTIASFVAPGIIASQASKAIAGRVEVGSVSLSWLGGQKVTPSLCRTVSKVIS